jgi:hypothetical protein
LTVDRSRVCGKISLRPRVREPEIPLTTLFPAFFPRVAAVSHHWPGGHRDRHARAGVPRVFLPRHFDQSRFA